MYFQQPSTSNFSNNKGVSIERRQPNYAKFFLNNSLLGSESEFATGKNYSRFLLPQIFSLQLFSIAFCFCLAFVGQDNFINFLNLPNSQISFADEIEYDDKTSKDLLANPMEKYFVDENTNQIESSDLNHNKQTQITKSAGFADRTIPIPIPITNTAIKKQNKQPNRIKLTSAIDDQNQNNSAPNNTNNIDSSNEYVDPFNAQAPPSLLPNSQPTEPNYNHNDLNNFNNYNYTDNNQNNIGFYQPQTPQSYYQPQDYTLPNFPYPIQPEQLQQYYSQYYPQYYPQYSPQYSPQYYPYFYGMYSPFGYGQSYNPYNFYAQENFYNNSPDSERGSMPQPNSTRREELFESEASRDLERIARREAAEAARLEAEWSPKPPQPILYPLLTKIWACVTTLSPFNTPTGPDRGVGMPLRNGSWLDRPYYFGAFIGKISGSELVSNMIEQNSGANGGLVLGYNMNEYWGLESRLHFASIDIKETANGAVQYALWYAAKNPGMTVYVPGLTTRSNQLTVIDISVHYYPLGNARFRPYFKYGLGYARESFYDTFGQKRTAETLAMPFGFGLRYWWNKQFAIHADIVDNIIFSHDIVKTQGNWSFCIGLTYSFGNNNKRRPIVHWPYTPSSGSRR
ncbi:MAG: outer membrane beta-barrel protein [Planctomycetaceae bacterium]|jgi:hypothetical protein|nr:outer membrane beta-barrel protein [Planctomycetaceae bacterium]